MKALDQDSLAFEALDLAFSGKRQAMSPRQHRQVRAVTNQARAENRESGFKKRLRYWNLGPAWAKRFA